MHNCCTTCYKYTSIFELLFLFLTVDNVNYIRATNLIIYLLINYFLIVCWSGEVVKKRIISKSFDLIIYFE